MANNVQISLEDRLKTLETPINILHQYDNTTPPLCP